MRKQTKLLLEENNRLEEALQPEARSLLTDVVGTGTGAPGRHPYAA